MLNVRALGCVAFLCALLVGCGESLNLRPATGTVTYQGRPVEGAAILFIPESGPMGTGTTDASGKYVITTNGQPGAIVAAHKVTVSKLRQTAALPKEGAPPPSPEDMKMMQMSGPQSRHELPEKYSIPQGSGLTATVTTDDAKNVFDFQLE